MDAAMHRLRAPGEELGDQRGEQDGPDGAASRWKPRGPSTDPRWAATTGLERPPGFV